MKKNHTKTLWKQIYEIEAKYSKVKATKISQFANNIWDYSKDQPHSKSQKRAYFDRELSDGSSLADPKNFPLLLFSKLLLLDAERTIWRPNAQHFGGSVIHLLDFLSSHNIFMAQEEGAYFKSARFLTEKHFQSWVESLSEKVSAQTLRTYIVSTCHWFNISVDADSMPHIFKLDFHPFNGRSSKSVARNSKASKETNPYEAIPFDRLAQIVNTALDYFQNYGELIHQLNDAKLKINRSLKDKNFSASYKRRLIREALLNETLPNTSNLQELLEVDRIGPKEIRQATKYLQGACVIILCFLTGMRNSDLFGIIPNSLEEDPEVPGMFKIKLMGPKINTLRDLPLPPVGIEAIRLLERFLALYDLHDSKTLFANYHDINKTKALSNNLTSFYNRFNLPHYSIHCYRKSVTAMFVQGNPYGETLARKLLGHKSYRMLEYYLNPENPFTAAEVRRQEDEIDNQRLRKLVENMKEGKVGGQAGVSLVNNYQNNPRFKSTVVKDRDLLTYIEEILDQKSVTPLITPLAICVRSSRAPSTPPCNSGISNRKNSHLKVIPDNACPMPRNCIGQNCPHSVITEEHAERYLRGFLWATAVITAVGKGYQVLMYDKANKYVKITEKLLLTICNEEQLKRLKKARRILKAA